jgi:hypothetical protein
MAHEPDDPTPTEPAVPVEQNPAAARKPYEPPHLVEYGDIATLTQTGGLTKLDTGSKKQRIG